MSAVDDNKHHQHIRSRRRLILMIIMTTTIMKVILYHIKPQNSQNHFTCDKIRLNYHGVKVKTRKVGVKNALS